ncbi:angiopoietin-related protein 7-like [Amphibalanus amphitrite]|uniref:angiopoietin-related protein 7-like n=1 Tax=Amphibalanus amphitrite TaxID=1232801 RepID=UPI001C900E14|nr:angiopoietin-related protein 7-like [Amphibalanus amphitrite]
MVGRGSPPLWAVLLCLSARLVTGDQDQQPTAQLSFTPDELWKLIGQVVRSEVQLIFEKLDLERRLETLDFSAQVTGLESSVEALNSRLNALDGRVYATDSRLNSKGDTLDARVDDLASQLYRCFPEPDTIAARLDEQNASLETFNASLEGCQAQMAELTTKLDQEQSSLEDLAKKVDQNSIKLNATIGLLNQSLHSDDMKGNPNDWRPRIEDLAENVNNIASRVNKVTGQVAAYAPQLELLTTKYDMLQLTVDAVNAALNASQGQPATTLPRDCSELPAGTASGIHLLQPGLDPSVPPTPAYCDLESDGGGWTVIQRRDDIFIPRENFYRDWQDYKRGFGKLDREFWWGLESLWRMTGSRDRRYQLRITLEDFDGERRHAVYGTFRVSSEADGYRLAVDNYSGDAGDALKRHNGLRFSTKDRDNDRDGRGSCATRHRGAWWYDLCWDSHLNGQPLVGNDRSERGICWRQWRGWHYSLKAAEMKIRPQA